MRVEELLRGSVDEVGPRAELVVEVLRQGAVGADVTDSGEARVVAVRRLVEVGLQGFALGDLPQAVRL